MGPISFPCIMMKLTDGRAYRRRRTGGDMVGVITSGLPVRAASGSADARRVRGRRLSGLRRAEYLNDIVEQDHAGSNARPDRGGLRELPCRPSHPRRPRDHGLNCARGRSRPFPPAAWPPGGPSWLPCSVPPPDVAGPPVRLDHAGTSRQDRREHAGQDAAFRPRWSPAGLVRHPWDRPGRGGRPGDGRDRARGPARRSRPSATGGSAPGGTLSSCNLSFGSGRGRPPRMHVHVPNVPHPPVLAPAAVRGAAA